MLDEPFDSELSAEERARAEMRRVADANRQAVEALKAQSGMRTV